MGRCALPEDAELLLLTRVKALPPYPILLLEVCGTRENGLNTFELLSATASF